MAAAIFSPFISITSSDVTLGCFMAMAVGLHKFSTLTFSQRQRPIHWPIIAAGRLALNLRNPSLWPPCPFVSGAAWRRRRRGHPLAPAMNLLFLISLVPGVSLAIRCAQCNGWMGSHPLELTVANTCDNRNNQCQTDQYCVKIVDPMAPGISYTTYKSDCWFQAIIQITPSNSSSVTNNACYPYEDASVPTKRWTYCFCNDRDYCNADSKRGIPLWILAFLGLLYL